MKLVCICGACRKCKARNRHRLKKNLPVEATVSLARVAAIAHPSATLSLRRWFRQSNERFQEHITRLLSTPSSDPGSTHGEILPAPHDAADSTIARMAPEQMPEPAFADLRE